MLIKSAVRRATIKHTDRIRVLSFAAHEAAQSPFINCNADFYLIQGGGLKSWDTAYRPVPSNTSLLNVPEPNGLIRFLPRDIQFDLVLVQNHYAHYAAAFEISQYLQIPLIVHNHCAPHNAQYAAWTKRQFSNCSMTTFISEFSQKAWGYDETNSRVIHNAIDTDKFCPNSSFPAQNVILSVVNDFINRDKEVGYSLWKQVTEGLPVKLVGNTPGLSEAAPNTEELIKAYQTSAVFFNSSLISPFPMSLGEGMATGLACVSTNNHNIPNVLTHGKDALLSNKPYELRQYLVRLLNNPNERKVLGENARQTAVDKFSPSVFAQKWDNLFREVIFNHQ